MEYTTCGTGSCKTEEIKEIENMYASNDMYEWQYSTVVPLPVSGKIRDPEKVEAILLDMVRNDSTDINAFVRKHRFVPSYIEMYSVYIRLVRGQYITRNPQLELALRSYKVRSDSGVHVFTIVMSDKPLGRNFTCSYDCHFCPKYPDMPRSYLPNEPAVRRGYHVGWDPVKQIRTRYRTYLTTGQLSLLEKEICKGDFIIEGGTYTSYPKRYREQFMRDLYYACNTIYDDLPSRERKSLMEEMKENETCIGIRVIGLSIETRPDTINASLIRELRTFGVTKVQMGVQHINNDILAYVNRRCEHGHTIRAMRLLLDNAFKVQIHLMPDLPTSSPSIDKQMLSYMAQSNEVHYDHCKLYPTQVVPYTEIEKWYKDGTYKPYAEQQIIDEYGQSVNALFDVCRHFMRELVSADRTDIRIERIVRDIPIEDVLGGCRTTNLGQILNDLHICRCIRCREPRSKHINDQKLILKVKSRDACHGKEYFLSYETEDEKTILALLRMRLPRDDAVTVFDEIRNTAMIREVHVYGTVNSVGTEHISQHQRQHKGLGSALVHEAELIAKEHKYATMSVISGNGVKDYYRKKHGFVDGEYYLIKNL